MHLRLSTSAAQAMMNNGVREIVYELENARLTIPLSALTDVILLPARSSDGMQEEIQIEDGTEEEIEIEDEANEGILIEENGISAEPEAAMVSVPVDGYDICIE